MYHYPSLSNKDGHVRAYPDIYSLPGQVQKSDFKWCTQAKLDGANFQIYFSTELKYASRNIDNVGPTWNKAGQVPEVVAVGNVLSSPSAKEIVAKILSKKQEESATNQTCETETVANDENIETSIHVFGELYGGTIHGMIQYKGPQRFTIFDIVVKKYRKNVPKKEKERHDEKIIFLTVEEVELFCAETGLEMIPMLAKGTLSEMLSINPETLHEDYEGGVIKPYNFRSGAKVNDKSNVTWPFVKNKKAQYLERQVAKPKPEHIKTKNTFFNLLTRERCLTNLNKQPWDSQDQFYDAVIQDARVSDDEGESLFQVERTAEYKKKLASFKITI